MSQMVDGPRRTFKAPADWTAKQFKICVLGTNDTKSDFTLALATGASTFLVGTIANKPDSGENVELQGVWGGGTGKVMLGGTVTAGAALTSDSNGDAIATTSDNQFIIGYAVEAGDDNDIIEYIPHGGRY